MEYFLTKQKALRTLLTAAEENREKHSYIFEGAKGIGKMTAAKMFAAAIHCEVEKKPCFSCPSCKKHLASTHSDLIVIGEDSPTIKVDDIRALTDELFIRPALSKKKIFIIENADNMNTDAQNALLKSFEEPPEYGIIILLSQNRENLLSTIRSRGNLVAFEPFSIEDIEKYIARKYQREGEELRFIAKYSGGVIGRAIDICENEEFFEKRRNIIEKTAKLTDGRLSIFELADEFDIKNKKAAMENCDMYFDLFLSFMRDVIAHKNKAEMINADMAPYIERFSSKVTLGAIINVIENAAKVKAQLNSSMKYELWIVNMLINCWEDIHGKGSRS